jgi:hypothetical protein
MISRRCRTVLAAMKCHRRLQQQYGKATDNSHRRQAGGRKIKVPLVIQG